MIQIPATIFVATQPVDLRLSFDRLAGIVRDQLGGEPRAEAVFVFHNRRRTHVKLLWHNGRAYCLFYLRLDRGTFRIPMAIPADAKSVRVSARELSVFLDGINQALLRVASRGVSGATPR